MILNLMQIDRVTNRELKKTLAILEKTNAIDVFYFADLFGNLNPKSIRSICRVIKNNWNRDFGFSCA